MGDPFGALAETARRLRGPGGCAWDRAQTFDSLLPHLIEETWEVFHAQRMRARRELQEELGDVLYTVLSLTLIAEEAGWLTLAKLLTTTREKMIRRHPHVFRAQGAATPEAAYQHWETAKRREQPNRPPSAHKRLRPLLVAVWDALRTNPKAERALQDTLEKLSTTRQTDTRHGSRSSTKTPKRPSATRARSSNR